MEFSESEESSVYETESKSLYKNKSSNIEQESYDFDREISEEEEEGSVSMVTEEDNGQK